MGFSHERTTHHFHLLADGGALEIQSNEPTDAATQEAIRQHLVMIAVKFSQGDFAIPMFIHATVPPGVETMKRLKSKVTFEAENTERGAQLRMTTHDAEALAAIHSFLRFQIQEYQTGDSIKLLPFLNELDERLSAGIPRNLASHTTSRSCMLVCTKPGLTAFTVIVRTSL